MPGMESEYMRNYYYELERSGGAEAAKTLSEERAQRLADGVNSCYAEEDSSVFRYRQEGRAWGMYKLLYLFLYLGSLGASLWATGRLAPLSSPLLGLGSLLKLFPLLFLGYFLLWQLLARRDMSQRQYRRGSEQLRTAAMVLFVMRLLTFALLLVLLGPKASGLLLPCGALLLSALACLLLFGLEHSRRVTIADNTASISKRPG